MKKEKFFEKLARQAPSLLNTEEVREQAIRDYYHDNPKQEKKDVLKTVAEIGLPIVTGGAITKLWKNNAKAGAYGGAGLGLLVNQLAEMGRGQKYLDRQGIKSNFIGTDLKPKTEKVKKRYFKNG